MTRCISDTLAGELAADYVNGIITVTPASPTLVITPIGTNMVLSWPLSTAAFTLKAIDVTNAPQGIWVNVEAAMATNDSAISATVPTTTQLRYFRLCYP